MTKGVCMLHVSPSLSWKAVLVGVACTGLLAGCSRDPEKAKNRYLESGKRYMQQNKYQEAAIQYRNALKIDPRFVEAYYQLAQVDQRMEQWNDAFGALQHAIELDPARLDARLSLGSLYLAAHNYKQAEEQASDAISRQPSNAAAYQLLGAVQMGQQHNDEAIKTFTKITELAPNDPSSYSNLGLVEFTTGHAAEAEQHFRKAIDVGPDYVAAYNNLANLYRFQRKPEEAGQVLQQGIAHKPDATTLYMTWMDVLQAGGKTADADRVAQQLRDAQKNSKEAAVAIGDFYFRHHDLTRALAEFSRGLSLDSNDLNIKNRVVDVYIESANVGAASALNNEVLKQQPKNVGAGINRGRILLAQGKVDDAITAMRSLVSDAPDSSEAKSMLGDAYLQKGEIEQGKAALQEALRLEPNSNQIRFRLAQVNLNQGNLDLARQYATANLQSNPALTPDHVLLGRIFMRQGDPRKARAEFSIGDRLQPNNTEIVLLLASTYAAEKNFAEAERQYQRAVQLSNQDPVVLGNYVDFLVKRGDSPKAVRLVEERLKVNPNDAKLHTMLGTLYLASKQYAPAITELQRSITLDPKFVNPYLQLGRAYQEQGQVDGAIQQFERAVAIQPKFPPLLTLLGNLYLEKKNYARARQYYEQALAVDPNFAIAAGNLAWLATQDGGNLDVALSLAQKARQLMPDLDSLADTLGWVQYKKGNYSNSIPLFEQCIQQSPDSAMYHFHLGMALVATGDSAKAKTQLSAALRLKLEGDDAEQARQTLSRLNQ